MKYSALALGCALLFAAPAAAETLTGGGTGGAMTARIFDFSVPSGGTVASRQVAQDQDDGGPILRIIDRASFDQPQLDAAAQLAPPSVIARSAAWALLPFVRLGGRVRRSTPGAEQSSYG